MRKVVHGTIYAVVVVASMLYAPAPAPAIEPITTTLAIGFGTYLLGYAGGKVLDEFVDPLIGKPDIRAMKAQLDAIALRENSHGADIDSLKRRLDRCATREEVRLAMLETLEKVDKRLADQAKQLYEVQKTQQEQWRQLGITHKEVSGLRADLDRFRGETQRSISAQGEELKRLDGRMTDFEKKYTRLTPEQQLVQTAVRGMKAYWDRDYQEALRWLRLARGLDEQDAGVSYALALTYRALGMTDQADDLLAVAVVRERQGGLPRWFEDALERVQGEPRTWLSKARLDPVAGVVAPGALGAIHLIRRMELARLTLQGLTSLPSD